MTAAVLATATIPVLLAAPGLACEPQLVAALTRPGAPIAVQRRCVDAADVIAAAATGAARVAIIGPALPRLALDTVARLSAAHVRVVGVVGEGDTTGERMLRGLGVPTLILPTNDLSGSVDILVRALDSAAPPSWEYSGEAPTSRSDPAPGSGQIVAVWGPTGAPGRTSVAIALADEGSRVGVPTLLVDADTYGGAVAPALGLSEDVCGLVVACRHADAGTLDVSTLAQAARAMTQEWRVLTGIGRPDRWAELRPAALTRLWQTCRTLPGVTVIDTGFCLEADEELLSDTRTPRRNAAALTALVAADTIVAVGAAEPVSLERLLHGLEDLKRVAGGTPIRVVITRARRSSVGSDAAGQVREALARHAGISDVTVVPDDRMSFDRCMREGRTLAEAAPRSTARRPLMDLARDIASVGARPQR